MDAFDGLADPTRRRLLARLAAGPLSAGELGDGEPVSRPAISKHLGVLRRAGLVEATADGRFQRYRLRRSSLDDVRRYLDELAAPAVPVEAPSPMEAPVPLGALDALELEVRRTQRDHAGGAEHDREEIA